MNRIKTQPPWDFLLSASRTSLQNFELSRLSHAANLRKEISQLLDIWVEESSTAMLARWLLEQRNQLSDPLERASDAEPRAGTAHSASDNVFPATMDARPPIRGPS